MKRLPGAAVVGVMLAAALAGCGSGDDDSADDRRIVELEGRIASIERSVEAFRDENRALSDELGMLRGELGELEAQVEGLEVDVSKWETGTWDKEQWTKEEGKSLYEGATVERTVALVEGPGREVLFVDHAGRGDRTVLVVPENFVDGETPLIVSLHGFGGSSADQAAYVPLHERIDIYGFALLLPNGMMDEDGNRFWNPTDECCVGGKSGGDDVAYLTELVEGARRVKEFGPVYFFGYSNGGFMAHHMACKGLPGLGAVASLAGTSYVEESSCEGAPPVSALHIHGTEDGVILYGGDATEGGQKGDEETGFYVGAEDMARRWSERTGCEWPNDVRPYASFDFDEFVPGAETKAFRVESGCAAGVNVELWVGEGSGHAPGMGEAFVDALLGWLLAQG